jgi:2-keto-4-pentenoate hydratase/2-oxohepta-3-ene-1,7-dioic acid hydratase in catechol pathway
VHIARFAHGDTVSYGLVDRLDGVTPTEESVILPITGHPVDIPEPTGEVLPLADVRLLAPIIPSKIVAVGRNYAAHIAEMGGEAPTDPMIFLKPSTSVVGPGAPIVLPPESTHIDHEAELAVVIGRITRHVSPEDADQYILGYTCANDVSARDFQKSDGQWGRAKGFDSFCPLGPWITLGLDPADLAISCTVNGEVRQDSSTALMIRDVSTLVSWISGVMTLLPGDVIITGTPSGVGPIVAGDLVSVSIAGIGTLTNPVVAR